MKKINNLLDKLMKYHGETYDHSLRVAAICRYLSDINTLDHENRSLVNNSGLLHDIGKLNVPLQLLNKKDKLTLEEKEIIHDHVRDGYLMLKGNFFKEISEVMVLHHEFSNNPYPRKDLDRRKSLREHDRREKKEKLAVLGQILAVSDMYDALLRERAYKRSLDISQVIDILRKQFLGDKMYIEQIKDYK